MRKMSYLYVYVTSMMVVNSIITNASYSTLSFK
jgi:hypothetical protein